MKNLVRSIEILERGTDGLPVIIRQGREVTIYAGATKTQIKSVLQ